MRSFIIAEAGVNHNGSFELACKMVDEAKKAGADCIKFQTFKSEKLVSFFAKKAEYQQKTTGSEDNSQLNMLKKLELSYDEFLKLKKYCDEVGIMFLSTPFDFDSIEFLNEIKMPFWKIPSGEVTNFPYLVALAKTKRPIVMSTGMCSMEEIAAAVSVLKQNGTEQITLLQCNTEYPTPYEDVNLTAMNHIRDTFGVEVGYSDHTQGIEIPIAAAALGAAIIEKHFTLDKNMEGPDHKASLDPDEFAKMVSSIRIVETALGDGKKKLSKSEAKNRPIARKSIVALTAIKKGEILSPQNLTVKRPGDGINPMDWETVCGTRAIRDFAPDELIEIS